MSQPCATVRRGFFLPGSLWMKVRAGSKLCLLRGCSKYFCEICLLSFYRCALKLVEVGRGLYYFSGTDAFGIPFLVADHIKRVWVIGAMRCDEGIGFPAIR
jgi:hypothetical protein